MDFDNLKPEEQCSLEHPQTRNPASGVHEIAVKEADGSLEVIK